MEIKKVAPISEIQIIKKENKEQEYHKIDIKKKKSNQTLEVDIYLKSNEIIKEVDINQFPIGTRVIDEDGNIGVIEEVRDLHNISVKYENGGYGIHCQIEGCDFYDPIKILNKDSL